MKLNPGQQEAVTYISGPCLVLAGAGSGKTRVITNKIAYLIQQCGYKAHNIAAVTFTNKAAREMRERIGQTLGSAEARGLMVSTFHTLGLNLLRKEYQHLGLKKNFSLFDEHDATGLLESLTEEELDSDKEAIRLLISTISNWKNDMLSPKQALQQAQTPEMQQMALFYERYQRQMTAYNALDFDDLILLPCLLLQQNEEVRQRWQDKIRYLLVDEYQDTNTAQYNLVKLLVGGHVKFTVVGDDDQSIYSWRGAKPQNLELLNKDFPSLRLIKLEQNYRSSGRILKAANILIANNPHVFDKRLFSELGYGVPLRVLYAKDEEHEADRVTSELTAHKFLNKTGYRDYAILYRGNHQSRLFEMSLMRNRIPYKISGGTSFFSRAEIKDMMAYLRLLVNPDDDSSFLRIINVPKRGIGPTSLEKLGLFANENGFGLFEAACHDAMSSVIGGKPAQEIQKFARWMVELSDNAVRSETTDVVRELVRGIGYEDWLYETSTSAKAAEMRMKNVSELYRWITEMLEGDELEQPMTLQEVVNRLMLRDMMERNESEENADQVQLMTLHASKGLEFPFVFMVGMEEGLLPHQTSMDEDNVEEERRLAYVGVTRAQQALTFTLCKTRRQYGELFIPEPSRFLLELPQDDVEWESRAKKSEQQRKETGKTNIANLKAILANKK